MKIVSVIIPVFNAEDTIKTCIERLLNQDYNNYEIVVINDGSTDKSLDILNEYKDKIVLINQSNRGVSFSRNKGIEVAKGKYIAFCDSDDFVEINYISSMVERIDKKNSLVVGKYRKYDASGKYEDNKISYNGTIELTKEYSEIIFKLFENCCLQSPFCKLFNKQTIINNNIKFDDSMCFGEDTKFVLDYLKNVNSICTFDEIIYNYKYNSNSLTHRISDKQVKSFLKLKEYFYLFMKEYNLMDTKVYDFYNASTMLDYYNFNLIGFRNKEFLKSYEILKNSQIIKKCKEMYKYKNINIKVEFLIKMDNYFIWRIFAIIKKIIKK